MTADEMRSAWREFTGEHDLAIPADDVIDFYFSQALQSFNRRVGYRYTDSPTGVTIVAATQEYTLPTDCQEVWFVEWNSLPVPKGEIRDWRNRPGTTNWRNQNGFPEEYALYGRQIVLRPIPTDLAVATDSTLTIRYLSAAGAFAAAELALIGSQDHMILVHYAVALWSGYHPDSPVAALRQQTGMKVFDEEVARVEGQYARRQLLK